MPLIENVSWLIINFHFECFLILVVEIPSARDGVHGFGVIVDPKRHWKLWWSTVARKLSKILRALLHKYT